MGSDNMNSSTAILSEIVQAKHYPGSSNHLSKCLGQTFMKLGWTRISPLEPFYMQLLQLHVAHHCYIGHLRYQGHLRGKLRLSYMRWADHWNWTGTRMSKEGMSPRAESGTVKRIGQCKCTLCSAGVRRMGGEMARFEMSSTNNCERLTHCCGPSLGLPGEPSH